MYACSSHPTRNAQHPTTTTTCRLISERAVRARKEVAAQTSTLLFPPSLVVGAARLGRICALNCGSLPRLGGGGGDGGDGVARGHKVQSDATQLTNMQDELARPPCSSRR